LFDWFVSSGRLWYCCCCSGFFWLVCLVHTFVLGGKEEEVGIYLLGTWKKIALCCSRQLSGVDRTSFPKFPKFPLLGNWSSQSPLDLGGCQGLHKSFMCQKETVMFFFLVFGFFVLVLKSWDPEF
jgi:hypothetical protein